MQTYYNGLCNGLYWLVGGLPEPVKRILSYGLIPLVLLILIWEIIEDMEDERQRQLEPFDSVAWAEWERTKEIWE